MTVGELRRGVDLIRHRGDHVQARRLESWLTDMIEDQTAQVLDGIVDAFRINWVWMPPWGPDKITPDGREQMRAIGFNI